MPSDRLESLTELFTKLKFRRQIIGGLSEADVWKKLEEVQNEYRRLYDLQAAGYEARLKEREDRIRKLEEELAGAGRVCQPEEELAEEGRVCQPEEDLSKAGSFHQSEEELSKAGGSTKL